VPDASSHATAQRERRARPALSGARRNRPTEVRVVVRGRWISTWRGHCADSLFLTPAPEPLAGCVPTSRFPPHGNHSGEVARTNRGIGLRIRASPSACAAHHGRRGFRWRCHPRRMVCLDICQAWGHRSSRLWVRTPICSSSSSMRSQSEHTTPYLGVRLKKSTLLADDTEGAHVVVVARCK
jgi:hypothetical protein